MTYRIAKSLDTLRDQVNKAYPKRSKASDGWIGDAKHRSRSSDHNPWITITEGGKMVRIVSALDITHDPSDGLDSERLAEALIASRDDRIKYIISNRKIISGNDGPKPWQWRTYNGANPHNKHVHVSVEDERELFDDASLWNISNLPKEKTDTPKKIDKPLLKKGSKKVEEIKLLQRLLNKKGYSLKVDGDFGPNTDKAVRLFQQTNGLLPDGKVGPYTWEKLGDL